MSQTSRFRTLHAGSLPQSHDVCDVLAEERREPSDEPSEELWG